jgi:lactoylglutathione lyase
MRINYVIVFVSDMRRAVSFYRDILEIPLRFESPGWSEFVTEGATLALHLSSADGQSASDAHGAALSGTSRPGLSVADLAAFHKRMVELNVICIQEPKDVFGACVAQYLDPDGLAISVGQERSAR